MVPVVIQCCTLHTRSGPGAADHHAGPLMQHTQQPCQDTARLSRARSSAAARLLAYAEPSSGFGRAIGKLQLALCQLAAV